MPPAPPPRNTGVIVQVHAKGLEMLSVDKLVPGFNRAIAAIPGGVEMARVLDHSSEDGALPRRTAALVRVAAAQRAGGPYARWVMARIAARESVGAEDVFLATIGTARDAVDAAVVKAAMRMASAGRRTPASDYEALERLMGAAKATEVVAQVALTMLACEALAAIAPSTGAASEPSRRGAQP
jgi:hypothetical protein